VQLLLRSIVEQTTGLLGVTDGGVQLYDERQDLLVLAIGVGFFSDYINSDSCPGEDLLRRAFQQRAVVMQDGSETFADQTGANKYGSGLSAVIAAPLLGRRGPLGVLFVAGDQTKRMFVNHDAQLVELLAAQAAIALENAQLYERQQQQYHSLRDAHKQLIQAEKMAALGRLIASISHEINNPLQAVQGCLALVREDLEQELLGRPSEEVKRSLQDLKVASTEVLRIASLVQRLRDFYRPTQRGLQPTDVAATINDVLALVAKQLHDCDITIEPLTAAQPPIIITTNADQLKQVALNLVLNAIDAMPGGGTLRITTTLDRRWLTEHLQPVVRIEFADTGLGILPANLNRIFEPFFTTKEHGSGLGLSISYELIKALGGELEVASRMDVGTTIIIYLPLSPDHDAERVL
jgi:two-component system NtrC family sensor kinase